MLKKRSKKRKRPEQVAQQERPTMKVRLDSHGPIRYIKDRSDALESHSSRPQAIWDGLQRKMRFM